MKKLFDNIDGTVLLILILVYVASVYLSFDKIARLLAGN